MLVSWLFTNRKHQCFWQKLQEFSKSITRFSLKYYKHLVLYETECINVGIGTNVCMYIQIPASHRMKLQYEAVLVSGQRNVSEDRCWPLDNFLIIDIKELVTNKDYCFRVGICFSTLIQRTDAGTNVIVLPLYWSVLCALLFYSTICIFVD